MTLRDLLLLGLLASTWAGTPSLAQRTQKSTGSVLVRNGNSAPISLAVADDYARRRSVRNILTVMCQDAARDAEFETIDFCVVQRLPRETTTSRFSATILVRLHCLDWRGFRSG